jgi:protocatechuate 3,4-dioxygenase, alpha subunit
VNARTPSQTVGPFFAIGLPWAEGQYVVPEGTRGAIWLRGTVYDGAGDPVPDSMVETWQPNAEGAFAGPRNPGEDEGGFRGFGRASAEPEGEFAVLTVKPGGVASQDGAFEAPHIDVAVFARGLLKHVVTRVYFGDEEAANAADPVLAGVDPDRRSTLIARPIEDGYRFDIRLQGEGETVFFHL